MGTGTAETVELREAGKQTAQHKNELRPRVTEFTGKLGEILR